MRFLKHFFKCGLHVLLVWGYLGSWNWKVLGDQFQAIMTQFLTIYFQIYLFALDWAIFVQHFLYKFSNSIDIIDQYRQKARIKRLFMGIFPFLSREFSLIWKTFLNPYGIKRAMESRCIQDLSWLEILAQVLRFDSCSFVSYLYQKCQPYHSFVPSRSCLFLQFING